ncbi:hypothetical protein [Carnobacterium pleistocenium]|uniref:hypothetical protein n=1 Tax=Carnobacterium pleistocenium TaxID=181073 RepID=UPI000554D8FC|nr:hypothetical protein [Carnobacterium pleistocenium]
MQKILKQLYVANFDELDTIPEEKKETFYYLESNGTVFINNKDKSFVGSVSIMKHLMLQPKQAFDNKYMFHIFLKNYYPEHENIKYPSFWKELIIENNHQVAECVFNHLCTFELKRRRLVKNYQNNKLQKR